MGLDKVPQAYKGGNGMTMVGEDNQLPLKLTNKVVRMEFVCYIEEGNTTNDDDIQDRVE